MDIQIVAKGEDGETITSARMEVNGFPRFNEEISPLLNKWQKTLTQQGQFPGENKVLVTITNDKGEETTNADEWD